MHHIGTLLNRRKFARSLQNFLANIERYFEEAIIFSVIFDLY